MLGTNAQVKYKYFTILMLHTSLEAINCTIVILYLGDVIEKTSIQQRPAYQ